MRDAQLLRAKSENTCRRHRGEILSRYSPKLEVARSSVSPQPHVWLYSDITLVKVT